MINNIINELNGKNIAILGFGMEGRAAYHFIRRHSDMFITIIDKNNVLESNEDLKNDNNISVIFGDNYLDNLDKYDLILKSPGVITLGMDLTNIHFTSQLELLLKYDKKNVIGITATKGKSTTSTLTYEVIKACGYKTILLGNIGKAIFDEIENIDEDTKVVVEMSALQLEFVDCAPHIGCIINLYEDHLDHAGTVKHYHENKLNMFKYQESDDYAIYCKDIEPLNSYINDSYKAIKYGINFSNDNSINTTSIIDDYVTLNNEKLYNINDHRILIGNHNLRNIMIVLTISKILNLDMNIVVDTINNFKGLEHRLEYVGVYNDITYYNDSIATIPSATINALESLKNVDTLIFGGMDRGIDYTDLVNYLNEGHVRNLICMPTTGYKIGDEIINGNVNIYKVELLSDAVKLAKEITNKNSICLMSPAAASYEYFKNFQEKGDAFKKLVKND